MSTAGRRFARKYHHNEHTDAVIRRAYSSEHYQRHAIMGVASSLGMPKHIVYRRACEIGCIQPGKKEPEWSQAETELLETLAHLTAEVIARKFRAAGYQRTPTAISIRRKRIGANLSQSRMDAGLYSCRQLAAMFGITSKVVAGWIQSGMLKAKRQGTQRTEAQHGDHWELRQADIRRFVIDYTAHIDFRKVDKFWLVDLLAPAGEKQCEGAR